MNKFMPAQFYLSVETTVETNERQIAVEVVNCSDMPIENVSVTWHYDYDDPFKKRNDPLNGEFEFLGCNEGALPPGVGRHFVFPKEQMPWLLSVVASLSSERHCVVIKCDDETEKIDGRTFGGLVEENFR